MKKLIFLPGMSGSKRDGWMIKRVLKNYKFLYFPYNTRLEEPFQVLAEQLNQFIKKLNLKKKERVYFVGVSAGGIILDYYLKFIDKSKLNKAAIICSPINGTYFPKIFSKKRKGIHQLEYSSKFLKKLDSRKLDKNNIISFWSFFDPLVPGTWGKYINPHHTSFFLHWIVHFWFPIIFKIKEFFDK